MFLLQKLLFIFVRPSLRPIVPAEGCGAHSVQRCSPRGVGTKPFEARFWIENVPDSESIVESPEVQELCRGASAIRVNFEPTRRAPSVDSRSDIAAAVNKRSSILGTRPLTRVARSRNRLSGYEWFGRRSSATSPADRNRSGSEPERAMDRCRGALARTYRSVTIGVDLRLQTEKAFDVEGHRRTRKFRSEETIRNE